MKTLILVKDNELASYPSDILVDGKIKKSHNLEFECDVMNITHIIGKSLPSILIKKLRDKGIIFIKLNSIDEIKELDYDIKFPKEFSNNRGWRCGKKEF